MPKISELTDSGAIQPGDSVPAVRSGTTVEVWPTVEQPASVSGTDTYTSDLGVDVSAGDKVCGDFANANTGTAPTLENTGGTPGALTITTKDGSALWSGALSGVHELQLASGGGSWLVLDPSPSQQVDPIAYADQAEADAESYADGLVAKMVDAITVSDSLTEHSVNQQSVGGGNYHTIFDLASATELVGGAIVGRGAGFRITVDGTVVHDTSASAAAGFDDGGDAIEVVGLPHAKAENSMKLEIKNISGASRDFGAQVYTR